MSQQATVGKIMDERIYRAAKTGDKKILSQRSSLKFNPKIQIEQIQEVDYDDDNDIWLNDEEFLCEEHDGSNIIHIAFRYRNIEFIEEVLKYFPSLIFKTDNNNDTVLHLVARLISPSTTKFLTFACNNLWRMLSGLDNDESNNRVHMCVWGMQNSKRNNFLHEAIGSSNYEAIDQVQHLLGPHVYSQVNENGETPLHMLARCAFLYKGGQRGMDGVVEKIVELSKSGAYMRDNNGMTPVTRAAQCGRWHIVDCIIKLYPTSLNIYDNDGKTMLHHLRLCHQSDQHIISTLYDIYDPMVNPEYIQDMAAKEITFYERMFKECNEVDLLRGVQDKHGNTPLHLAIKREDVGVAKFLLERCLHSQSRNELSTANFDGHMIFDQPDTLTNKPHYVMVKKEEMKEMTSNVLNKYKEITRRKMEMDTYNAAAEKNTSIFTKKKDCFIDCDTEDGDKKIRNYEDSDYFLNTRTRDGSNILHVALKYGRLNEKQLEGGGGDLNFMEEALKQYPFLLWQKDCNGDTPLHLATKLKNSECDQLFSAIEKEHISAPWGVKNGKGNMPIHEAFQTNNFAAAYKLLQNQKGAFYVNELGQTAFYVNELGQTPLHVFAQYSYLYPGPTYRKNANGVRAIP